MAAVVVMAAAIACSEGRPLPARGPFVGGQAQGAESAAHQGPAAAGAATRLALLFSASTAGHLVPCGCSPDQRGGLPRAAAYAAQARRELPDAVSLIDAGDALFAAAAPPSPESLGQARLKAETLAQAEEAMGVAARVVAARDLPLGAGFATQVAGRVPLLDAGLPVPGARAELLLRVAGVPVGLFAAGLGPDAQATLAARAASLRSQGARVVVAILHPSGDGALGRAQALLRGASSSGIDLAVLGRRDDPGSDPDRADVGAVPLLAVEGHGQSLLRVDLEVPAQPAPSAGPRLQLEAAAAAQTADAKLIDDHIARLRERAQAADPAFRAELLKMIARDEKRRDALLHPAAAAKAPGVVVAKATFVPLTPAVGDDPAIAQRIARYDDEVAQLNLAAAQKMPASCPRAVEGEASFVGVSPDKPRGASCASCHQTAAEFWTHTRHAQAYATLEKVHRQFSMDCVSCHVTGWQQPGGVCRIDLPGQGGAGVDAHGSVRPAAGATFDHHPRSSQMTVPHASAPQAVPAMTFGAGRRDVQCEMCHGAGSEHVKDPPGHLEPKPPEAVCVRCHTQENSPHFDDAAYRPWIVGPGHGEPLASGERPRPRAEIDAQQRGLKVTGPLDLLRLRGAGPEAKP